MAPIYVYVILGEDTHTCSRCVGAGTRQLSSDSEGESYPWNRHSHVFEFIDFLTQGKFKHAIYILIFFFKWATELKCCEQNVIKELLSQ